MQTRELGHSGPQVSAIGLGCMGISHSCGTKLSKRDGVALIRAPELTQSELREINDAASRTEPAGDRYAPAQMAMVGRDAPTANAAT